MCWSAWREYGEEGYPDEQGPQQNEQVRCSLGFRLSSSCRKDQGACYFRRYYAFRHVSDISTKNASTARWRLRDLEKFYKLNDHQVHWGVLEDAFPYKRANRFEQTSYQPDQVTPWNEGTCKWLLRSLPISADWLAHDASAFLWVRGPAGIV